MKYLIFLIIFLGLYAPVNAEVLNGGVSYTVDEIRKIAFQDVSSKIDINEYKKYFVFEKNTEKKLALLNIFAPYRINTRFSDNSYAVIYKNDSEKVYYYDLSGHLEKIDFLTKDKTKWVVYDNKGNLVGVYVEISYDEQYVFDNQGNFVSHWKGRNCYNEKGELILTRE